MNTFYNTTSESGPTLTRFTHQAESQETVILRFFKERAGQTFTPSQINQLFPQAPIHSIRARITSLEKRGELVKTAQKRMGEWGRPEHCWVYPKQNGQAVSGSDLLL